MKKPISFPELRQAQVIVKEFGELSELLDSFQEKLYNYSHYATINELKQNIDSCKEVLKMKRDFYQRKLNEEK